MMKSIYSLTICFLFSLTISAQSILSMRVQPSNPTTIDSVMVLVDLQFTSTGCDLSNKGHSLVGNRIVAATHHCVGMALAICNVTDTFYLGGLNQGTYVFDLTLTSGAGAIPCTPGIVPNDFDTMSFTVGLPLGLIENDLKNASLSPNPANNSFSIKGVQQKIKELKIVAIDGSVVMQVLSPTETIDIDDLAPGIYIVQLSTNNELATLKLVKK